MTTKFSFINHASVIIKKGPIGLITDPWFGFPFHFDTFHCFPPFNKRIEEIIEHVTHIHISHIHQDHFCRKSLSFFPRTIPVLISTYENKKFKQEIEELGFENVIEISNNLDSFYKLDDLQITTLHGEKNENSFDSLLIIKDQSELFFLNNDCEISEQKLLEIRMKLGQLTGAFLGYTYVNPYPTCYSISGKNELLETLKAKKIKNCYQIYEILRPEWIYPYANNLRFLNEKTVLHNRIFENKHAFIQAIPGSIDLDEGVHELDNYVIAPTTNTDEDFILYEEKIKIKFRKVIKSAALSWVNPLCIRVTISGEAKEFTMHFSFKDNLIEERESDPDLVIQYPFFLIKDLCDEKINWQQLHYTYQFQATIHKNMGEQSQPHRWKVL